MATPQNKKKDTRDAEQKERQVRWEEMQAAKLERAKVPGSVILDRPLTPEMEALVFMAGQYNQLFPRYKVKTGSIFGGVNDQNSAEIEKELSDILFRMARLGKRIAKATHQRERFNIPHVMAKSYMKYEKQTVKVTAPAEKQEEPAKPAAKKRAVKKTTVKKTAAKPKETAEEKETAPAATEEEKIAS